MSHDQGTADRVEIEAPRGEVTDAVMMRGYERVASLFTLDGVWQMPDIPADRAGRDEIRAFGVGVPAVVDHLVQTMCPGTIVLDGDTAWGRGYVHERGQARDPERRDLPRPLPTHPDGWRFSRRVYEIRYLDTTPPTGSARNTPAARAESRTTARDG